MPEPTEAFTRACDTLGLSFDAAMLDGFGRYLDLLLETNKSFNLTAIRTSDQAWMRHVLDSVSLLPFVGEAESLIDVGSGGGLPGIPLAIARPELRVTMLEATGKKARFIADTCRALGLKNTQAVNTRAESAAHDPVHREHYDIATARAVGPLNVMLEYTLPFVVVGGRVLAMKGKRAEAELRDAGDAITRLGGGEVNVYDAMPGVEEDAVVVEVHKEHRTPRAYPRSPGTPRLAPL